MLIMNYFFWWLVAEKNCRRPRTISRWPPVDEIGEIFIDFHGLGDCRGGFSQLGRSKDAEEKRTNIFFESMLKNNTLITFGRQLKQRLMQKM